MRRRRSPVRIVIEHGALIHSTWNAGDAMKRHGCRCGGMGGLLGGLAFVALTSAAAVSAEDPPPLERVQTIPLAGPVGGLDHLAVDAKRGRLFVANTVGGTLDVVDLKAGKLLKQVPGQGRIRGVAYSPETDRVFVGNGTGGICNTF